VRKVHRRGGHPKNVDTFSTLKKTSPICRSIVRGPHYKTRGRVSICFKIRIDPREPANNANNTRNGEH
jgi:hypothetical protein